MLGCYYFVFVSLLAFRNVKLQKQLMLQKEGSCNDLEYHLLFAWHGVSSGNCRLDDFSLTPKPLLEGESSE
jgi:hypothetical protein